MAGSAMLCVIRVMQRMKKTKKWGDPPILNTRKHYKYNVDIYDEM